jgi:hypothetical protein
MAASRSPWIRLGYPQAEHAEANSVGGTGFRHQVGNVSFDRSRLPISSGAPAMTSAR